MSVTSVQVTSSKHTNGAPLPEMVHSLAIVVQIKRIKVRIRVRIRIAIRISGLGFKEFECKIWAKC